MTDKEQIENTSCQFCDWVKAIKAIDRDKQRECKETGNDFFDKYELHLFAQLLTKLYEKETQTYINTTHNQYGRLKYCPMCGRKFEEE